MDKDPGSNKPPERPWGNKAKAPKRRRGRELLTQHIAMRRDKGGVSEESPVRKLELELANARKELAEQKGASANLAQQLASTREAARGRGSDGEAQARKLQAELPETRDKLQNQKEAAERLVQQLAAERDGRRAQRSELESRIQALGEEFAAAQEQFRQQRESAVNFIHGLEAERDELRAQLHDQAEHVQKLEKALVTTQNQLQEQGSVAAAEEGARAGGQAAAPDSSLNGRTDLWRMAASLTLVLLSSDLLAMNRGASPETEEAVREIQLGSQKLLEFLRNSSLQPPTPQPAKPHQPAETPGERAGPFGTITPA